MAVADGVECADICREACGGRELVGLFRDPRGLPLPRAGGTVAGGDTGGAEATPAGRDGLGDAFEDEVVARACC